MDDNEVLEGTVVLDETKSLTKWWNERKIVQWFKAHPDAGLTLLGGVLSIAGAAVKIVASNKEYEDSVYFCTTDDEIYKLPAKQMKTVKQGRSVDEVVKDFD